MKLHVTNNIRVVTENEIVLRDETQKYAVSYTPMQKHFLNEITIGDRTITLNKRFGHFVGMYVGDGWCDNNISKIHLATVEESHKQLFIDYVNEFLRDYDIKEAFKNTFGHGAKNKKFPKEFVNGNKEFLFGLLSGLIDTDGTINSSYAMKKGKMHQNKNAMYETSSMILALLVQSVCFSLGINASINIHRREHKNTDEIKVIMSTIDIYREKDNLCIMERKKQELNKFVFGSQVNPKDVVPFPREYRDFLSTKGIKSSTLLRSAANNGYMTRETLYNMFNDEQIKYLRDRYDIDNRKFELVTFSKECEDFEDKNMELEDIPNMLKMYLIKEATCKK